MSNTQTVLERIALPYNITEQVFDDLLTDLCVIHPDDADIYLQNKVYESWILEDGIIKALDYSTDQGVGFRVVCGETTGYAFSEDMDLSVLQATALAARSIGEYSETVRKPVHAVDVAQPRLYTDVTQ